MVVQETRADYSRREAPARAGDGGCQVGDHQPGKPLSLGKFYCRKFFNGIGTRPSRKLPVAEIYTGSAVPDLDEQGAMCSCECGIVSG